MLVRLMYVSKLTDKYSTNTIESILSDSRRQNPETGITGLLVHSDDIFLQTLEGGRQQVNALYNRITKDPRHQNVVLLHYEEITERMFGSWSMGQVNLAKLNASTILRYSETTTLDPYAVSSKVSLALLNELIASAAIIYRS